MRNFLLLLAAEPDISRVPIMIDSSKLAVIEAGMCMQLFRLFCIICVYVVGLCLLFIIFILCTSIFSKLTISDCDWEK